MPYPTIKPLFVALFMTLDVREPAADSQGQDDAVWSSLIVLFALGMTSMLYAWLTSPLEPHHH